MSNRKCQNCGRHAPESEQMYTLRLELFARVEPLEFTDEDLQADTTGKMVELIAKMETMDPEEAADQVFERYEFDLCTPCRRKTHEQLKDNAEL